MSTTPPPLPSGSTATQLAGIEARVEAAGRYLVEVGGQTTSADLGRAAGCANTTRRSELITHLEVEGLAARPKRGVVKLTPAGWARWSGQVLDVGAGDVVDRALAGWPYAHRAFLELVLSAIIARHHLGHDHLDGHLGFMAIGETGTGKSAMADLVVRLFALPPELTTLDLPAQSAGAVLGRRERTEDGSWALLPSPSTTQSFLFLDEVDKAEADVRRRAWSYFQGKTRVTVDGDVHQLRPVPMLAANPPRAGRPGERPRDRYAIAPSEYRRRSAVLDTGYMRARGEELGQVLREYSTAAAASDRLDLSRLVPPATQMSQSGLAVLDAVRGALTESGLEEFPGTRTLALVALGRAALMGTQDLALAAYATGVSYLQVTETVPGQVGPWIADARVLHQHVTWLRTHFDVEAEPLVLSLERARAERAEVERQRVQRELSGRMAVAVREGEVVEFRALLDARLVQARDGIDRQQLRGAGAEVHRAAKGLRERLATVRSQVAAAATLVELQALARDVAAGPVERAEQLRRDELARRQQRREDAAERARLEHQAVVDARRVEAQRKAQTTAARRQLREHLHQVQELARPLERLYARRVTQAHDNPLTELRALRVDGQPLLRFTESTPASATGARRGRFLADLVQVVVSRDYRGTWHIAHPHPDGPRGFPGSATSCPALQQWGPGTRAVLAGPIAALHAREDQVATQLQLTARARRRRPPIVAGALRPERPALPSPAQRSALPRGPSGP